MSSRFKSVNLNITKTKLLATLGVVAILFLPKVVFADKFDDQIKVLNKKVADNQNAANAKTAEANSLKSALSAIEAQINVAQTQLDITNTKISDTELEIKATNRELDRQRNILKDNLRLIYKEGYVSPLEIIASSANLSDFVAKQQYLASIKNKISDNLEKIAVIKKGLDEKKSQLTALSTQQKNTYEQIATQRSQQQSLLQRTEGDEANYRKVADEDTAKINELRMQQAAIIGGYSTNVVYGGTGGYPWASSPWPNLIADPWGMFQRQCVSYTAWRVAASGKRMPYWGGIGNAKQWPGNAVAYGIPVDNSPRPGDIAISTAGEYGHAMYVEKINGNGTVHVSQYNANWEGSYSTSDVNIAGLQFIHF